MNGRPSVGDTIESLGVPHPEVSKVLVNGKPALLSRKVRDGDRIIARPARKVPRHNSRFVLDVHLGKLARYLRLLGLDTLYRNDYSDRRIGSLASRGRRTVLTRDIGLLKRKRIVSGYWLREQKPVLQLAEVLRRFVPEKPPEPFSRCLACNGRLRRIAKKAVETELLPRTRRYYDTFYRCAACRKVYWPGSHYRKMKAFLKANTGQRKDNVGQVFEVPKGI